MQEQQVNADDQYQDYLAAKYDPNRECLFEKCVYGCIGHVVGQQPVRPTLLPVLNYAGRAVSTGDEVMNLGTERYGIGRGWFD